MELAYSHIYGTLRLFHPRMWMAFCVVADWVFDEVYWRRRQHYLRVHRHAAAFAHATNNLCVQRYGRNLVSMLMQDERLNKNYDQALVLPHRRIRTTPHEDDAAMHMFGPRPGRPRFPNDAVARLVYCYALTPEEREEVETHVDAYRFLSWRTDLRVYYPLLRHIAYRRVHKMLEKHRTDTPLPTLYKAKRAKLI